MQHLKKHGFNGHWEIRHECNFKRYDSRPNVSTPLSSVFIRGDEKLLFDSSYALTNERLFSLMGSKQISNKRPPSSRIKAAWAEFMFIVYVVDLICMFRQKLSSLFYKENLPFVASLNTYQTDAWFVRYIRVCSLFKEWNNQSRSVAPLGAEKMCPSV